MSIHSLLLIAVIAFAASICAKNADQSPPDKPPQYRIHRTNTYNICMSIYSAKSFLYFYKKKHANKTLVYTDEIKKMNTALRKSNGRLPVFAKETDIRRPDWIHAFSLYCGYTYCDSEEKVKKMAKPLQGLTYPLPTGNFQILDWEEHQGYIGTRRLANQNDGFFYTTVHHGQKIITPTWRGSNKPNDFAADADRELIGFEDELAHIFANNATQNPLCANPKNTTDAFFFGGFIKTVQRHVLELVLTSLTKAKRSYPTYSIVINGHSLGGAKAILVATYLSKYHFKDLPLAAVYTFGQPIVGSTKVGEWMAKCVGPEKYVRVVASDDLVPWMRFANNVQHPESVIEVYNSNANSDEWIRCQGSVDHTCSHGILCALRGWLHHSQYGGFRMGFDLCRSLPDPSSESTT